MIKDELIHFVYCMHQLIVVRIPLVEALRCCLENMHSLRPYILKVIQDIQNGFMLSEALKQYPRVFDSLFINYVALGERTGKSYFEYIYQYLLLKQNFRKHIKKALIYPIFVGVFIIILLYGLSQFLLPEFLNFLTEQHRVIPFSIYLLIFFMCYAPYILLIIVISIIVCVKSDFLVLKIPIIGKWVEKYYVGLYFKIVSIFLSEKIPLTNALAFANNAISNISMQNRFIKVLENLKSGQRLYESLPYDKSFIKIAEEYGFLADALEKLSVIKEKEVENDLDMFTKILEPLLIVVLGSIIFLIVFAIWSPLYDLGV